MGGERPKVPATGFTLTELVVVAGIVAACAAIAVPSYRGQLIRARRSEAVAALMALRAAEEKHFLRTGRYSSDVSGGSSVGDQGAPYVLTVTVAEDGLSYVAIATSRAGGSQSDDARCRDFTIDQRGTRGVTGPAGPDVCWK